MVMNVAKIISVLGLISLVVGLIIPNLIFILLGILFLLYSKG